MEIRNTVKHQKESLPGWKIICWLLTLFGLPIVFPWLLYRFFDTIQQNRLRRTLKGKVVMVTGASSGLGEALAHAFYSCGCKLILVSRRKEELMRVRNTLTNTHPTVPTHPPIILVLDLTDLSKLEEEVSKTIMIHGRIDVLVNNAGISYRGDVADTDIDVDIKLMKTNYISQIALNKIILPFMISQQGGHIICISSVQGRIAIPFRSAYAASKHASQAWYDCARAELSEKNIKFTVVNPGYIKTNLSLNALTGEGQVYGVTDEATEKGYEPAYVAECILQAILKQKKEFTIAPFYMRSAIILRVLFPSFFMWIMRRRARKLAKDK